MKFTKFHYFHIVNSKVNHFADPTKHLTLPLQMPKQINFSNMAAQPNIKEGNFNFLN